MRQETLAETLRELAERRDAKRAAEAAYLDVGDRVPEDLRHWHAQAAYLRGYDDAKAEAAHTEMLLREAQDEIANAQARVRELEAFIEAQAAHDHWEYHCEAGSYYCATLLGLLREIVSHRWWHWRRGDGWSD
jgi:hypothetical protein